MQTAKCLLLCKGRSNYQDFRTQTFERLLFHVKNSLEQLTIEHLGEKLSIFLHWNGVFLKLFMGIERRVGVKSHCWSSCESP